MVDYSQYGLTSDDVDFLKDLRGQIVDGQCGVALDCSCNNEKISFFVEPMGDGIDVWQHGAIIGHYTSFDEFLLNFVIDGKPFIECISNVNYSDDF